MNSQSVIKEISDSIKERKVIEFIYDGNKRTVQPHIIGIFYNESTMLSACRDNEYNESGKANFRRYYKVSEISRLRKTDRVFKKPGKDYDPEDKRFKLVICKNK